MQDIRIIVEGFRKDDAQRIEETIFEVRGVKRVDAGSLDGSVETRVTDASIVPKVVAALKAAGFAASVAGESPTLGTVIGSAVGPVTGTVTKRVAIKGMTCRSCEVTIERKFRKLPGVKKVEADAGKGVATIVCEGCEPDLGSLRAALKGHEYEVRGEAEAFAQDSRVRPSFLRLLGLFAAVFLLSGLLKKLGLFSQGTSIGGTATFATALVLGLVAGSSSCIAVSGGLLLSSAAKFNERYGSKSFGGRMRPVFLFIAGRTASYAVLGGLIGALGASFSPSPFVTGAITVFAALFMLVMGLDMLRIAPDWLKGLMPRLPKSWGHRVLDAEGKEHPAMPLLLGAGTFFLPCGFTQALQLYALSAGSFWSGAAILGGFAIGTAPALFALGWASSALKGNAGRLFFQFTGALVIVLGLWNLQNGFTIAGYPLSLPSLRFNQGAYAAGAGAAVGAAPIVSGKQVIRMTVGGPGGAYDPDAFTVKAGIPVRWEIDGQNVGGCISSLISRQFGVRTLLRPGPNVVEFTPTTPGTYAFSCSMGMFRGSITVVS